MNAPLSPWLCKDEAGGHQPGKWKMTVFIYFFINLFIYLFLVVLGLRCCTWASSSCGERGLLFVVVHRLLTAVVSLAAEHGL